MPKISAKVDRGHTLRGRRMQVGWVKIGDFRQINGYISKTVKDRHMQHSVFHTIAFLAFSCLAFSTTPQHGAAFSCLAISTLASWCRKFMSRIFSVPRIPFLCIFTNLELQERYLPIVRGTGTPFPCVPRHFNQFITNAALKCTHI